MQGPFWVHATTEAFFCDPSCPADHRYGIDRHWGGFSRIAGTSGRGPPERRGRIADCWQGSLRYEAVVGGMIRDQYQGGSTVMTAISSIEIAMWDIIGKACSQPIWRL